MDRAPNEISAALADDMSHAIRTPMNAIVGLSHLLLKTDLTPRQRDYILKIQASGQHLLAVINGNHDFTDVEPGMADLEAGAVAMDSELASGNAKSVETTAVSAAAVASGVAPGVADGLEAIRGARILLVEDNDINREVARDMLQDAGLVVEVAANGQVALAMVQQEPYDLVFMDMQMPVMDGVTATVEIRRRPLLRSLPIVAMTANAMEQDLRRCIDAGMDDFLVKPIDPPSMWAMLLRWVRPAAQPVSAADPSASRNPLGELPEDIPGLDTALGLSRMMGKKKLYLEMLRRFVDSHRGVAEEISMSLAFGDTATAERLAHTVKGVGGSIGATPLHNAASELEQALKDGVRGATLQQRLREFETALTALVSALDRCL